MSAPSHPMKNWPISVAIAVAAMLLGTQCNAATIRSFELAEAGASLSIRLSDGRVVEAPFTHAEQEGFSDVHLAANRRLIGWTATFANCCTSYPLPRSLVVHDGSRVVRVIGADDLSIFDWRFSADSGSVIFHRELPHGDSPHLFRRVRLSDGKRLDEFDCRPVGSQRRSAAPTHPPAWTGAHDLECGR